MMPQVWERLRPIFINLEATFCPVPSSFFYKNIKTENMLRSKLLFALIILSLQMAGATSSLRSVMVDVNAQWAYRPADLASLPNENYGLSPTQAIQKHLLLVQQILSKQPTEGLSTAQLASRKESLAHLLEYAQRGQFPTNLSFRGRRPVFIDHLDVHCAVGHLIMKSGHPGLSNHLSANLNYQYLKDMKDPALADWVAQSGFSLAELAWIQPGYPPPPINWQTMKGGVSGPVYTIAPDMAGGVLVAGTFDTAGTFPAQNFADWYPGFAGFDWLPAMGAPNGPVHDILHHKGKLYIAGSFTAVDTVFTGSGVAVWDGSHWEAVGAFYVGALNNYVNDLEIYRDTLYAGGFFRGDFSTVPRFSHLAKWNGTGWVKAYRDTVPHPDGLNEIHALHVHNGKLIVGGSLSFLDSLGTKSIFTINGSSVETLDAGLPNMVYALETYNGELYAGTDYLNDAQTDTAGLMVYRNSQWQRVVPELGFGAAAAQAAIYTMEATPYGMVFGGEFQISPLIGQFSINIGAYNGSVIPLGVMNGPVRCLFHDGPTLYVGGEFTQANSQMPTPLGYIANLYLPDYLSTSTAPLPGRMEIFPNPASHLVHIKTDASLKLNGVELYDIKGTRLSVPVEYKKSGVELDVQSLRPGHYIIRLSNEHGILEEKLVVAERL